MMFGTLSFEADMNQETTELHAVYRLDPYMKEQSGTID